MDDLERLFKVSSASGSLFVTNIAHDMLLSTEVIAAIGSD